MVKKMAVSERAKEWRPLHPWDYHDDVNRHMEAGVGKIIVQKGASVGPTVGVLEDFMEIKNMCDNCTREINGNKCEATYKPISACFDFTARPELLKKNEETVIECKYCGKNSYPEQVVIRLIDGLTIRNGQLLEELKQAMDRKGEGLEQIEKWRGKYSSTRDAFRDYRETSKEKFHETLADVERYKKSTEENLSAEKEVSNAYLRLRRILGTAPSDNRKSTFWERCEDAENAAQVAMSAREQLVEQIESLQANNERLDTMNQNNLVKREEWQVMYDDMKTLRDKLQRKYNQLLSDTGITMSGDIEIRELEPGEKLSEPPEWKDKGIPISSDQISEPQQGGPTEGVYTGDPIEDFRTLLSECPQPPKGKWVKKELKDVEMPANWNMMQFIQGVLDVTPSQGEQVFTRFKGVKGGLSWNQCGSAVLAWILKQEGYTL